MKNAIIKNFDKLILVLLGILGLTNCDMPKEYGSPQAELYGCPSADYEVKGTVTNSLTSEPIRRIRVVLNWDTIYTDDAGKYRFDFRDFPQDRFNLKFEDIDGEENGGEFMPKTIELIFTDDDQIEKGSGHWYDGKFAKTQNVALDPLLPAPMYGPPSASY
ncbi:MAG: radical SAM-associated putative lipoprotein [Dysgonamonadaceae bacterium]|nr:radical SAM-associated putative lipoprotein [Dysgonamonadaceae bacterium]